MYMNRSKGDFSIIIGLKRKNDFTVSKMEKKSFKIPKLDERDRQRQTI